MILMQFVAVPLNIAKKITCPWQTIQSIIEKIDVRLFSMRKQFRAVEFISRAAESIVCLFFHVELIPFILVVKMRFKHPTQSHLSLGDSLHSGCSNSSAISTTEI